MIHTPTNKGAVRNYVILPPHSPKTSQKPGVQFLPTSINNLNGRSEQVLN